MKQKELDLFLLSDHELIPSEIVIYLTATCKRADCKHCIIKDNFSGKTLSIEILNKIFSEMNKLEIPFVSFTGGEPFDYEYGLENAISLAKENNLFVNQIITNASFAENIKEAIKRLENIKKAGFSSLKIKEKLLVPTLTISTDEAHQATIPIENVKTLIKATGEIFGENVNLTINYVLFSESKEDVLKKYPWMKKINIDFSNVCYEGRATKLEKKNLLSIKDNLEKWNNPCNWNNKNWPTAPAIFPDGNINFCCYFGLNDCLSLGNIDSITLKEALNKINNNKTLLILFEYGPVKLISFLNNGIKEEYTYGKCGLCNILLKKHDNNPL
jgi:MoaA/NifB/PqqE/SkfB family radical SAM enzyme